MYWVAFYFDNKFSVISFDFIHGETLHIKSRACTVAPRNLWTRIHPRCKNGTQSFLYRVRSPCISICVLRYTGLREQSVISMLKLRVRNDDMKRVLLCCDLNVLQSAISSLTYTLYSSACTCRALFVSLIIADSPSSIRP